LDSGSQEYQKAAQLIKVNGQLLAENINFTDLLNSVGTSEYVKNALQFIDAVEDYNAYLLATGETTLLDAENLLKAVSEGGKSAVAAAKVIA